MQSLVIKMIYERQGNATPEIRRFPVPDNAALSYTFINEKVMQVFPHLDADTFTLGWTDEDGDSITFSSEEELKEALSSANDSVMKIVVREHDVTNRAEGVTSLDANTWRRSRVFGKGADAGGYRMMETKDVQPRHSRRLMRMARKIPQQGREDAGQVDANPTLVDGQVTRNYSNAGGSRREFCRNGRRWQLQASCGHNGAGAGPVTGWRHRRRQHMSNPTADEDTATEQGTPTRVCGRRRQRELGGLCQRDGAESDGTSPRPRWWRRVMQEERPCPQKENVIDGTSPSNSCGQRWRRRVIQKDGRLQRDETTGKCGRPWRRRMMTGLEYQRGDSTGDDLCLNPHWRSMQAGRASRYAMGTEGVTMPLWYYGCHGARKSFPVGCRGFQESCSDRAGQDGPGRRTMGHHEVSGKRWRRTNEPRFGRWSRRDSKTEDEHYINSHCTDSSFASCQRRRVRCTGVSGNTPGCKCSNEESCLNKRDVKNLHRFESCPKRRVRLSDDVSESHDKNTNGRVETTRGNKWQRAFGPHIRRCIRRQGRTMEGRANREISEDVMRGQMNDVMPTCNEAGCDMQRGKMCRSHRRGPTFRTRRLRIVRRMRRLRYLQGLKGFYKHPYPRMHGHRRRPVLKTCRRGLCLHLSGTGAKVGRVYGFGGKRGGCHIGIGQHLAETINRQVTSCYASNSHKFKMGDNGTNCRNHERKSIHHVMGRSWGRQKAYPGGSGKDEGGLACQMKHACDGPEDVGTQTPFKLTFHEMKRLCLMRRILQKERKRQFRIRQLFASRCGQGQLSKRPVMKAWGGKASTCTHGGDRVLRMAYL
ncbi:uncharacterized protein LOC124149577 [Haliotis rufescens]|uniref:uncharacterized protein LOC124149577 n=1 Tax=Haliotis rufescens TaxID=6454 RepID=UPI00201F9E0D|nr:uncharacterized protein LOC124149577 [Haliotis rufescens]